MKIYDSHAHAGGKNYYIKDKEYDSKIKEYYFILKKENIQVEKTIFFSQPNPYPEYSLYTELSSPCINYSKKNDEIGKESKKHDNALFAPIVDIKDYNAQSELERSIKKYEVSAIKIHSSSNNGHPRMLETNNILKVAEKNNLPIIIHLNPNYSNIFYETVKDYKKVNFIIAHLGFLNSDYMNVVKKYENAYFDTSAFVHPNFKIEVINSYLRKKLFLDFQSFLDINIKEMKLVELLDKAKSSDNWIYDNTNITLEKFFKTTVTNINSKNILFGSDYAWSDPIKQINFIKNSYISEEDKKNIFSKNFEKIFKI